MLGAQLTPVQTQDGQWSPPTRSIPGLPEHPLTGTATSPPPQLGGRGAGGVLFCDLSCLLCKSLSQRNTVHQPDLRPPEKPFAVKPVIAKNSFVNCMQLIRVLLFYIN